MSFLTGLLSSVLEWALSKFTSWIAALINTAKRQSQVDNEAQQSVQPLKDAKTPEEIDAATHDALDHL